VKSLKTCVIFCAGEFDTLAAPVGDGLVIAADGGYRHCVHLGIHPDVILGDFDSLGYAPEGAQVFPVEKDDTDSMLAVRRGLSLGCNRFLIYGGLDGPRLDHTIANLQTLQFLADQGAQGIFVGKSSLATVISGGCVRFPARSEGLISVFCMGSDANGVTIQGLQYELSGGTLSAGFPLGVSNHFIGRSSEISVENGSLLIIYDRNIGFPEGFLC
jgi:thiamine pyrophosphokinase